MINRRELLATGAAALALPAAGQAVAVPDVRAADPKWQAAYDKALKVLDANVQMMPRFSKPVLIEGATYQGIWMECGPHEALVYRKYRPDVARNSHETFFELQRADGQLPCNNKLAETGFGQIQMVVPIAATALELARATGNDALLAMAYKACAMWDAWLLKYRNTRGTGLTEGFCTYDTGHDNSPRWQGIPPQCPNKDAKRFPTGFALPRLCPDLSATTYGARLALAQMAKAQGLDDGPWLESAEAIRKSILARLYVAEDAAFYDLDADNKFVRVRGDILTRVCGEHVVDQPLFDDLWTRQLHNPKAFWSSYPLPSIALDDPTFVRPITVNSWGGPAQALTALRAPRWMEHYGRPSELAHLLQKWAEALINDMNFLQQLDPETGAFTQTDAKGYSPAALVMIDATWRLCGVVETPDELWWNARPGHPAAGRLSWPCDNRLTADMAYTKRGVSLTLGGKPVAHIDGTARLVTDTSGKPLAVVGIAETPRQVTLKWAGQSRHLSLKPNQRINL